MQSNGMGSGHSLGSDHDPLPQTFQGETMPVVEWFRERGNLRRINAEQVVCCICVPRTSPFLFRILALSLQRTLLVLVPLHPLVLCPDSVLLSILAFDSCF